MTETGLKSPDLQRFGQPGEQLKTALGPGVLGYYLETMLPRRLDQFQSKNPAVLIKLWKDRDFRAGLGGVLGNIGNITRRNQIPAAAITGFLQERGYDQALVWSVWRQTNYWEDLRHQKRVKVVIGGLATTLLAIGTLGALISSKEPTSETETEPKPTLATTAISSRPTRIPPPTFTPEPSPTLNPEELMGLEWQALTEKFGYERLESRVADSGDVQDLSGFKLAVADFLQQHNLLTIDGSISYNPGEQSEIYLWMDHSGGILRIKFDGRHVFPPWVAHTFYYDPVKGKCGTMADQTLADGSWQVNEIKFNPERPETCIGMATTISGRKIVIGFIPGQNGKIEVKAAIFTEK